MWWKVNKWKVLTPVLVLAVLAGAFWWGGNAPGTQGWTVDQAPPQADGQTVERLPGNEDSLELPDSQENTPASEPQAPDDKKQNANDKEATEPPHPPEVTDGEQGVDPETGKDQYLTDPVPVGRPLPVEPQDVTISDTAYTCTLSISCANILNHMDWLDEEKAELVPEDGWILEPVAVTFYEGESVFNVLQRTCKQNKIHMEFSNTPIYNSAYIEGIHNLYEFDCGERSGWMYKVNEWFPNYGCSRYGLKDGDVVCWEYTCDLGQDTGGYNAAGG